MYRSFLLKNNFWAKKGNEKNPNSEKVFIKHDELGGVYAIIQKGEKKGVKIITDGEAKFFDNFGYFSKTWLGVVHHLNVIFKVRMKQL